MKKVNLSMAILFYALAFYIAWQIDIEKNGRFAASSCIFLTMVGAFRYCDFLDQIKQENESKHKPQE